MLTRVSAEKHNILPPVRPQSALSPLPYEFSARLLCEAYAGFAASSARTTDARCHLICRDGHTILCRKYRLRHVLSLGRRSRRSHPNEALVVGRRLMIDRHNDAQPPPTLPHFDEAGPAGTFTASASRVDVAVRRFTLSCRLVDPVRRACVLAGERGLMCSARRLPCLDLCGVPRWGGRCSLAVD